MERIIFLPQLAGYIAELEANFGLISEERKQVLVGLADFVRAQKSLKKPINLLFICTHNSRRSQMAELWAAVASYYYGLEGVNTFSGGTEVTAFNPRSVASLRRAGFKFECLKEGHNPLYKVFFAENRDSKLCYSKTFNDSYNPQKDFCAVMTCSSADADCPFVAGAARRISLAYEDPKDFDNTAKEQEMYDKRSQQIAVELFYMMSKV